MLEMKAEYDIRIVVYYILHNQTIKHVDIIQQDITCRYYVARYMP